MKSNIAVKLVGATCFVVGMCSHAVAAPTYCSAGANSQNNLDTGGGQAITDVTLVRNGLGSPNANDCFGVVDGNDTANPNPNGGNTTVQGLFPQINSGDWFYADRDIGNSATVFGVTWTVDAVDIGSTSGSWSISGVGTLPQTFDFMTVLKGSNGFAAYFFDNVLFDAFPDTGAWKMTFNNASTTGGVAELSHMTLYVRGGTPCTGDCGGGGQDVPEPASLALVGLGLAGLGAVRRRKRA